MPVERRRHLRHKVHSPAYASIGAGVGGVVLDANDRGAAIESVARLTPQTFVDLRLDLLDTRGSAVTPARVAWCDEAGRLGLEFLNLTGESRRQLQQWLLLNALLATEKASELAQAGRPEVAPAEAASAVPVPPPRTAGEPGWREVAERALASAEADGAAIALAEGVAIVCRATAGDIAPPPGTKLNTESGISGACVRSGRWLRCDDPRLDPHVDRESCQALGISSVLAVPIGQRGDILGLIEVFSRAAYAFKENHCSALQELAKTVALSLRPEAPPAPAGGPSAAELAPEAVLEESPVLSSASTVEAAQALSQTAAADAPAAVTSATTPEAPVPAAMPVSSSATPAATQTPAMAPVPEPITEPTPSIAPSSGKGERVVLVVLAAMLVILGLWFVLGRGTGDAKSVDAAEPSPARSQIVPQPAPSGQARSEVTQPTVTVDLSDSVRPLQREAEAGDAEAAFELGARYASGEDVTQDYAQAVKWFTRAADGGQVLAAATLGAYYWAGRGVPQDDVSAYMWSAIAKEGGDEASKYRLAILRARMSGAQISEAEQRASAWRRTRGRTRSVGRTTTQP